ncbi:MAG: methyltransferase domain-containing protein [Candidatus Nealsonbacteria bacterium]
MDQDYAQYLLNKGIENYNAIAEDFSSTRRFVWQGLEPLYHYALPEDKVLDLGCGNGRLLQIFKGININYTGVDNSDKLTAIAKKTYPDATFLVADALHLPFPQDHFDKVYSIAVLHHIPSQELRLRFLKEAKRVLKPGGLLILTVWDLKRLDLIFKFTLLKIFGKSKLDFGDVLVPWQKKHQRYVHCFTKREMVNLAQQAGFSVKESGTLKTNFFIIAQKS